MLSTQKCEATNKAIGSVAPKNKTFSRNFSARVHSAVNAVNNGIGMSVLKQTEFVGAPITPGSRVTKGLLRRQNKDNQRKVAKKSPATKEKRQKRRKLLYSLYDDREAKAHYKTGMALREKKYTRGHLLIIIIPNNGDFIQINELTRENTVGKMVFCACILQFAGYSIHVRTVHFQNKVFRIYAIGLVTDMAHI